MNWIKEHEIDSWLLRGAVALMLLFPAFYSPYTDVYQSAGNRVATPTNHVLCTGIV